MPTENAATDVRNEDAGRLCERPEQPEMLRQLNERHAAL